MKKAPSIMQESLSVAVIGAGMSGLTAARALQSQGCNVRIFEKSRGPGGRMSTRRHRDDAFDHGAQYFTVRDERFRREVNEWSDAGVVERWDLRPAVVEHGRIETTDGGPERFVGAPKMSAIGRFLSDDLEVVYSTRVGRAEAKGDRWELISEQGIELGDYDVLIVAVPPAQAVPFLGAWPEVRRIVESVSFKPCWATMAAFDEPLDLGFDGAFVHGSPLSWVARNTAKPGRVGRECWVLHGSPRWSASNLEEDAASVAQVLLSAFFEAAGLEARPASFLRAHRWLYSVADAALDVGCFWDADRRVGVCGDWCRGSRVEGAYLSGLELADRVLRLCD